MAEFSKGPQVYRGSGHYVPCDSDGWHRDWLLTGRLLRKSCLCADWSGGCPNKATPEELQMQDAKPEAE